MCTHTVYMPTPYIRTPYIRTSYIRTPCIRTPCTRTPYIFRAALKLKFQMKNRFFSPSSSREKSGTVSNNSNEQCVVYAPPTLTLKKLPIQYMYMLLLLLICYNYTCTCLVILKIIRTPVNTVSCVNSGFRREVDENCALLDYFAASSADGLTRNVDKKLPLLAAEQHRRAQFSAWFLY